jgi:hypothetical protein
MNLNGEGIARVEDLAEKGKALRCRGVLSENERTHLRIAPEFGETPPIEGTT